MQGWCTRVAGVLVAAVVSGASFPLAHADELAPAAPPVDARASRATAGAPETTRAQKPTAGANVRALARIIDRPHTITELEAGIIALPSAPISAGQSGGNTPFGTIGRGDATLETGLRVLYRWNRHLAAGAGVLYSPFPTSDPEYGGLRSLPRTHTRSYFFFGGEGRYIPLHYHFLEAWVGASVGGVVIADRFTTDAGDQVASILGSKEVTIRTEGFAVGLEIGGSYYISENWIAGASLRAYRWTLPTAQRCSTIGDCATLSGSLAVLELGLTIGYRLPL